ncbi:hypothetical protein KUV28_19265 [Ferrimonas balearica]|nr:hypothetical protein [Ferrimonas balearica]
MARLHPHAVGAMTVEIENNIVEEIARLLIESIPSSAVDSRPRATLSFDELTEACGRRVA